MKTSKLGVWSLINQLTAAEAKSFARRVEDWGYGTLWLPEPFGRDPMVAAALILIHTEKLQVATGIASTYARDPMAMVNAQYGLNELSNGRFLLGIGISHSALVEGYRKQEYQKPLPTMKAYLQAMAQVEYMSPAPAEKPKTVIAALGPKMLEVAATMADGAHPYNVTPEHTAKAREILGPDKLLCVEQKVVFEADPAKARAIARRVIGHSLHMPNYRTSFLRMGFGEEDLQDGGSNRLIDGIVAWGDEDAIRKRIQQHWDAGADQVCMQVVPKEGMKVTPEDEKILELLAPQQ